MSEKESKCITEIKHYNRVALLVSRAHVGRQPYVLPAISHGNDILRNNCRNVLMNEYSSGIRLPVSVYIKQ